MKANELKITDIRVADIDGLPKHMILVKVYTNDPEIIGYGEVRDASSATYAKMLKSRLVGENPLNVEKLFNRIKQFGDIHVRVVVFQVLKLHFLISLGNSIRFPFINYWAASIVIKYVFIVIQTWMVSIRGVIWVRLLKNVWTMALPFLKWT